MTFYQFCRFICRPHFTIFYPTKLIGRENFIDGKALCICNHYSLCDSMIITCKLFPNDYHALIKKESFETAIGNWYLTKMGMIPVDRKGVDIEAMRKTINYLRGGSKVLMYPEGTRNKGIDEQVMGDLKNGVLMFAHKTGAPIIPMMYYRRHRMFRKNYLIIGKPIETETYMTSRYGEIKEELSEKVRNAFIELRYDVNYYAENKCLPEEPKLLQ